MAQCGRLNCRPPLSSRASSGTRGQRPVVLQASGSNETASHVRRRAQPRGVLGLARSAVLADAQGTTVRCNPLSRFATNEGDFAIGPKPSGLEIHLHVDASPLQGAVERRIRNALAPERRTVALAAANSLRQQEAMTAAVSCWEGQAGSGAEGRERRRCQVWPAHQRPSAAPLA
jgi:hypothetical protein